MFRSALTKLGSHSFKFIKGYFTDIHIYVRPQGFLYYAMPGRPKCSSCSNENKQSADLEENLKDFNDAYKVVKESLLYTDDKAITDAVRWSSKVLEYNVHGGKKTRGVTVLKAYEILSGGNLTSDGKRQACLLGWCVEMLQGFFLVFDDIMDQSLTRRGKPCWYQNEDVGLIAINDGLLLEHGIYKILKMHFKASKSYSSILHEFLEVTQKTAYGQALDILNAPPNKKPKYEQYNLEKYSAMVEYKTSHYTFCLPVHLAMHYVDGFSEETFEATRKICLKLGLLFQIQDDYLDVYGDPEVTGKKGTDIIDGKCSWFAAYVFQHASPDLKQQMIDNYGMKDPECVSRVLEVYEKMDLVNKFHSLELKLQQEIENLMKDTLIADPLRGVFQFLLAKLHGRKK